MADLKNAWFHCLPGVRSGPGEGALVQELDFNDGREEKQITVTFTGNPMVASLLANLAAESKTLPRLWYIREVKRPPEAYEDQHAMTKVKVERVLIETATSRDGSGVLTTVQIKGGSSSVGQVQRGMTMNPGPPPGAPADTFEDLAAAKRCAHQGVALTPPPRIACRQRDVGLASGTSKGRGSGAGRHLQNATALGETARESGSGWVASPARPLLLGCRSFPKVSPLSTRTRADRETPGSEETRALAASYRA